MSDGGQQDENPQLMCVWVGGEAVDEAPQQISACDIPAASRESLAAHRQVSAFCLFFKVPYWKGGPQGSVLGPGMDFGWT